MLRHRLLTALLGLPLGLAVIYLGGWYLTAVVAVLAVVGFSEYLRLSGYSPREEWVFYALLIGLVFWSSQNPAYGYSQGAICLLAGVLLGTAAVHLILPRCRKYKWLPYLIRSQLFGLAYIPLTLGYVPQLRNLDPSRSLSDLPAGALWLFLVVGATWAMDIAAYVVGKAIGRHKLCPAISPGKTVEGAVGAMVGAVAVAWAMGTWLGLSGAQAVALGLLLGVGGQLGDLFESFLKRRAGVKDSGALLPGHGGVLDRFDSLLFNAPLAYYFLRAALG